MDYKGWEKTKKGKVTYARKKNFIGLRDLYRIIKKRFEYMTVKPGSWETFEKRFYRHFSDWKKFGGGTFGGGGATRDFGPSSTSSPDEKRYIFILEGD